MMWVRAIVDIAQWQDVSIVFNTWNMDAGYTVFGSRRWLTLCSGRPARRNFSEGRHLPILES